MKRSAKLWAWVLVLGVASPLAALADDHLSISTATRDDDGLLVHEVRSDLQGGKTRIRVLTPSDVVAGRRYPVVYVLPVEPPGGHRYGDGMLEVKQQALHGKHRAIFVGPDFSRLPWYADHPTDPTIRQERYFIEVVVPFIERTYPAIAEPNGRFLLGFSKSGWGAWSLMLRHPDSFERAAAWDAPLMMDRIGKYGSAEILGTEENFAAYQLTTLVRQRASTLGDRPRLLLLGYSGFRHDHQQMHALLDELRIGHIYRDGPQRKHDWHSGWLAEAVELLLGGEP